MFNFTLRYQTGHSNRAADALSCHQFKPSCDIESKSDNDDIEVMSYSSVGETVDQCFNSSKIPKDLKQEAQDINCAVQSIVKEEDKEKIVSTLDSVFLFKKSYT